MSQLQPLTPPLRRRGAPRVPDELRGGLFNADEPVIDPREAIRVLPAYLSERYGIEVHWRTPVTSVEPGRAHSGSRRLEANRIYARSGAEFEPLYPERYAAAPLMRCKLQRQRLESQPAGFRVGAALCGGFVAGALRRLPAGGRSGAVACALRA